MILTHCYRQIRKHPPQELARSLKVADVSMDLKDRKNRGFLTIRSVRLGKVLNVYAILRRNLTILVVISNRSSVSQIVVVQD